MTELEVLLDPRLRLLLVTGNPGAGKSAVAKLLFCRLREPWELLSLDAFIFIGDPGIETGNVWDSFEANAEVRATAIGYYTERGGNVVAEGIVQSDREVETYCRIAGVPRSSAGFRFIELFCSEEAAVTRMQSRPLKEGADFPFAQQYHGLRARLKATGATRIRTDGKSPAEVVEVLIDALQPV